MKAFKQTTLFVLFLAGVFCCIRCYNYAVKRELQQATQNFRDRQRRIINADYERRKLEIQQQYERDVETARQIIKAINER